MTTSPTDPKETGRSRVKSRQKGWAQALAARLARHLSPNAISVTSVVFSALGAAALCLSPHVDGVARYALLAAAACLIQLRLLANLMDGMVAVENARKQATGDLFNELPDRLSDSLLIVAAGYASNVSWAHDLGWAAALLALLTEYVRALAGASGLVQTFAGLIGKPQRMFLVTLAAFGGIVETATGGYRGYGFAAAIVAICLGSLLTNWQRTVYVYASLERRGLGAGTSGADSGEDSGEDGQ